MDEPADKTGVAANVRNLSDALRRVRIATAERSDVVVELREAERARLDMLADELRSVFAQVPEDDDQFIFAVMAGNQPRLWIDITSFVALGRDRRTYRFLKDTRFGRTVILESADLDDMADAITHYVAERIIERERALEGDWLVARTLAEQQSRLGRLARLSRRVRRSGATRNWGWIAAAFMLGLVIGAILLLAYAWVRVPV